MKIGYPCINNSINCTSNSTFRLINYSEEKLISKITNNLDCLKKILEFNYKNNILFFRIGSGLIPFASHPVCKLDWRKKFKKQLELIGYYILDKKMRISMHPDQFVVLNTQNSEIVNKSIKEIDYHCSVLDSMGLREDAKVQIHIGGVYGNKNNSINRFIENYFKLTTKIKKRLVIENDHISYSLKDCLYISKKTNIPIIFDTYHHQCLNNGESFEEAIKKVKKTWRKKDGRIMLDYSHQNLSRKRGAHTNKINVKFFKQFLSEVKYSNFDIMLEIKDKEKSALKVVKLFKNKLD